MANIKSAQKAARQNEKARVRNLARKTAIKTSVKKVLTALEQGSTEQAAELLRDVAAQLGRARGKNLVHANTASRKLSRLAKKVAQSQKAQK
jgi:small subunit ribosomal protein S20